ncbi:MAG: glycosyltransferase family 4 protein [Polyangiaceae bacterium]
MPLRVAIVSEYVRPWPGGISEHVHHEAHELRGRGHTVTVFSGPDGVDSGRAGEVGGDVVRLPRSVTFRGNGARSRLSFGASLLRLGKVLDRSRFDVVHVHAPLDPLLGVASVLAAKVPVVGTFHASHGRTPGFRMLLGTPWSRRAFAKLHTRVAVSEEARRTVGAFFEGAVTVVPNGVDTARFHPEHRVVPAAPTLLFVGRPDARKGLAHALAAFARVRRTVTDARLVLAGPSLADVGPEVPPGVAALGYVASHDLPRIVASADVLVAPSLANESQGIVLLEAMASGVVPVAYRIPGYDETVRDGEDGVLVPRADVPAFADAVTDLLEDPERRMRMSSAAVRRAATYAWTSVAPRIESLLVVAAS